ncbi:hypothetical protein CC80DRAFT_541514 [Byssothecium circinans]|uniref:Uncharacterized protein n=1 Tax=Byssothecium circinans TaxID=147558 RepID=A0A6A5UR82_9PLEO|nr:hypothetical protein CC80DRAFT_541514 [Byssothecium circinans]
MSPSFILTYSTTLFSNRKPTNTTTTAIAPFRNVQTNPAAPTLQKAIQPKQEESGNMVSHAPPSPVREQSAQGEKDLATAVYSDATTTEDVLRPNEQYEAEVQTAKTEDGEQASSEVNDKVDDKASLRGSSTVDYPVIPLSTSPSPSPPSPPTATTAPIQDDQASFHSTHSRHQSVPSTHSVSSHPYLRLSPTSQPCHSRAQGTETPSPSPPPPPPTPAPMKGADTTAAAYPFIPSNTTSADFEGFLSTRHVAKADAVALLEFVVGKNLNMEQLVEALKGGDV